jgi:hypothetical protein
MQHSVAFGKNRSLMSEIYLTYFIIFYNFDFSFLYLHIIKYANGADINIEE